jgi:hypothetical protein
MPLPLPVHSESCDVPAHRRPTFDAKLGKEQCIFATNSRASDWLGILAIMQLTLLDIVAEHPSIEKGILLDESPCYDSLLV